LQAAPQSGDGFGDFGFALLVTNQGVGEKGGAGGGGHQRHDSKCYYFSMSSPILPLQSLGEVELLPIRSQRMVVTIQSCGSRHKVLQIFFGRDGSLFVNFPYFQHRTGVLAATAIPSGQTTAEVNLEFGGRVASHLVKYSHHPDGRAHFSQDGKVRTEVKRQSIPLDSQRGHIFSVLIQGLAAFTRVDSAKDVGVSPQRAIIEFDMGVVELEALKVVGRWHPIREMRIGGILPAKLGPIVPVMQPDGRSQNALLIASPYPNPEHTLVLTCEAIPRLSSGPEALVFYGGFDARAVMTDTSKKAGFLAFIYPTENAPDLMKRIGTVDFER